MYLLFCKPWRNEAVCVCHLKIQPQQPQKPQQQPLLLLDNNANYKKSEKMQSSLLDFRLPALRWVLTSAHL